MSGYRHPRVCPILPRSCWRRRSCSAEGSLVMEQQLLVIELVLHASPHGIADGALVSHTQPPPPLRCAPLARAPARSAGLGLDRAAHHADRVAAQTPRPPAGPPSRG